MSQPQHSPSPLTARLYDLEYPRSLGVYSTYHEVQAVVDALADKHFPVQATLIVGTDLKLMERVTGRRTWGKVILQGIQSGLAMGLFLGILLMLMTPGNFMIVLTSVLMGIVFFTVWAAIGYFATGGKRDFTSMTATIPMQYELLVEHKHAAEARRLLAESGAAPAMPPAAGPHGAPLSAATPTGSSGAEAPRPAPAAGASRSYGAQAPGSAPHAPAQSAGSGSATRRPTFGRPAHEDTRGDAPADPRGTTPDDPER